jgi:hypothetical protein
MAPGPGPAGERAASAPNRPASDPPPPRAAPTTLDRFADALAAVFPPMQPTWCFPGFKTLSHLGQWPSSVP